MNQWPNIYSQVYSVLKKLISNIFLPLGTTRLSIIVVNWLIITNLFSWKRKKILLSSYWKKKCVQLLGPSYILNGYVPSLWEGVVPLWKGRDCIARKNKNYLPNTWRHEGHQKSTEFTDWIPTYLTRIHAMVKLHFQKHNIRTNKNTTYTSYFSSNAVKDVMM